MQPELPKIDMLPSVELKGKTTTFRRYGKLIVNEPITLTDEKNPSINRNHMFEQESLQKIDLYKKLHAECHAMELRLKEMVELINAKWDKETSPRIESIKAALEAKLIYERNKLAEIRGE